jgi:hypothetical protein
MYLVFNLNNNVLNLVQAHLRRLHLVVRTLSVARHIVLDLRLLAS